MQAMDAGVSKKSPENGGSSLGCGAPVKTPPAGIMMRRCVWAMTPLSPTRSTLDSGITTCPFLDCFCAALICAEPSIEMVATREIDHAARLIRPPIWLVRFKIGIGRTTYLL